MVTRNQISDAARTFIGLPYNPGFPSKGFLIGVAQHLGLPYCEASALRGKIKSEHRLSPGDIVVVRIGVSTASHAIVTRHPNGDLCLVRPDQRTGKIVEHRIDEKFRDQILQVFELKEVQG